MPRARLALLTFAIACSSPTATSLLGARGGQEASVVLTSSGGTVSYLCGSGTIDSAWTVTEDGRFTASGLHYFGGGPVPPGGGVSHPARYSGRVDGDTFVLAVAVTDADQTLGPFHLFRGGPTIHELCQ